jgi:hypothetical protein
MAYLMMFLAIGGVASSAGTSLIGYATAALVGSVWSLGIFSNFRHDPQSAPGFAVLLSVLSGFAGIGFIIGGLVI